MKSAFRSPQSAMLIVAFVFEENGRTYLFYTICGGQGIAAVEITGM
jgi:hypothetical protein